MFQARSDPQPRRVDYAATAVQAFGTTTAYKKLVPMLDRRFLHRMALAACKHPVPATAPTASRLRLAQVADGGVWRLTLSCKILNTSQVKFGAF